MYVQLISTIIFNQIGIFLYNWIARNLTEENAFKGLCMALYTYIIRYLMQKILLTDRIHNTLDCIIFNQKFCRIFSDA